MIDIQPGGLEDVYAYAGLKLYIASFFDGPVDVIECEGLKSYVRPAATGDALYAF